MDFFQKTPSPSKSAFQVSGEAEACAAVLIACLRSNELDSDEDNAAFYSAIKSRNIFKGHDPDALVEIARSLYEQAGSPAALIDAAIGAIREQTRLPLFYHCLDVIMSDGVVTPRENKVYLYLKAKFKVDDELAWKALDVMVVKNQL